MASNGWRARSVSAGATGVGLPNEAKGRVPDLSFKQAFNKGNPDGSTQVWLPGDGANLAVGQGDLVVTPLQLATAYAAFANGGILYQPRIATKILENSGVSGPGKVVRDLRPSRRRGSRSPRRSTTRSCRGSPARSATRRAPRTAAFQGYNCNVVAGKTGTAQTGGAGNQQDNALFCGFTPLDPPPADSGIPQYVVCVVVEHGGFGGSVAAPIARRIFDYLLGNPNPAPVHVSPPKED